MERHLYDVMAADANTHWWYVARRKILDYVIKNTIRPSKQSRILEVGCGTGHNLRMLSRHGNVDAVEPDDCARAAASNILGKPAVNSNLPSLSGIERGAYDLIAFFDVLEHIEADREALTTINSLLASDGTVILTVPAHQWMWSQHDLANHHVRRYSKKELRSLVTECGFDVKFMSYFNSLLFPIAVATRLANIATGSQTTGETMPSPFINRILERVFRAERHLLTKVSMPIGLSIIAILTPSQK